MNRSLKLPLLLMSLLACLAFAADTLTVKQLQAEPKKFDAKEVAISGQVDKFEQRTSKAGNDYFVFILRDKSDKKILVNIFGRGKLEKALKDGSSVEVKGTYRIEKKLGTRTYKNELETKPKQIKVLAAK